MKNIVLDRLGNMMKDLAPYKGAALELQWNRDIFYRETCMTLKVGASVIIMDRSRKGLLRIVNGKPIDLPGALDFLADPSRTGEKSPTHGTLFFPFSPFFPHSPVGFAAVRWAT